MGSASSIGARSFDKPMTGVLISTNGDTPNNVRGVSADSLVRKADEFVGLCKKVSTNISLSKLDLMNFSKRW
jgi:hypothetical protein